MTKTVEDFYKNIGLKSFILGNKKTAINLFIHSKRINKKNYPLEFYQDLENMTSFMNDI